MKNIKILAMHAAKDRSYLAGKVTKMGYPLNHKFHKEDASSTAGLSSSDMSSVDFPPNDKQQRRKKRAAVLPPLPESDKEDSDVSENSDCDAVYRPPEKKKRDDKQDLGTSSSEDVQAKDVSKMAQKDLATSFLAKYTKPPMPDHKDCVSKKEYVELKEEVHQLKKRIRDLEQYRKTPPTIKFPSPVPDTAAPQTPVRPRPKPSSPQMHTSTIQTPSPIAVSSFSLSPSENSDESFNGYSISQLHDSISLVDNLYYGVRILLQKLFTSEYILSHSVSGKASNSKCSGKPRFDSRLFSAMLKVLKMKFTTASNKDITEKIHSVQKYVKKNSEQ